MPSNVSYKLKHFTNTFDPDFAAALLIYTRNTASNIRTDTNEITYWLNNFRSSFEDDFYVFGFYRNKQLVGFAEVAYFYAERLFIIDYIVIDEASRRNNVFYEFVDQLKCYLEGEHPDYRYGVAEVTYGSGEQIPSPESCLISRLLKLQGFRIICAPYFQPRLMFDDIESEMKADLLIYSATRLERINSDTYLNIVKALYYKYYLRWKSIIPDSNDAYKKHLDALYLKIESNIKNKKTLIVNGHQSVLKSPSKKSVLTVNKIILFSLQGLIVVILLTAAMLGLKRAFNLSNTSLITIYIISIASFMAVAGLVSKEAREIFREFTELAKFFSRRKLDSSKPIEIEKENPLPSDPKEQ
jgi:hypothetical protein